MMLDFEDVQTAPFVVKNGFDALGDDPSSHRWRATWVRNSWTGTIEGISIVAHPVIKVNPCSVWVSEMHGRLEVDGRLSCIRNPEGYPKRLCLNNSGASWAKPTQAEAVKSLAVRLDRWANHIAKDLKRARSAAVVLENLYPNFQGFSKSALGRLE